MAHKIPAAFGKQKIHATMKDADGKRIEHKVLNASGNGRLEVAFDVPACVLGNAVQFAVFIGEKYTKHLQHLWSGKIAVE